MPAHLLLQRVEPVAAREGETFFVRWRLANAGDAQARVQAWCVWFALAHPDTVRADQPPGPVGGSMFSDAVVLLQPGQQMEHTERSGVLVWDPEPPADYTPYFVASVEYTDATRAARRLHYVQGLRPGDAFAQHCHFASLTT